jgi:hypothetical protein
MTDYTIAIYCFFDDYLKVSRPKEDGRRKMTDAAVITTALVAARYFHGNLISASGYMQQHHVLPKKRKKIKQKLLTINRFLNSKKEKNEKIDHSLNLVGVGSWNFNRPNSQFY